MSSTAVVDVSFQNSVLTYLIIIVTFVSLMLFMMFSALCFNAAFMRYKSKTKGKEMMEGGEKI